MKIPVRRCACLTAALCVILSGLGVSAQAQDTDSELTVALIDELRELRIAIQALATTNSRVQVLVNRAEQQDQRLSLLTTQLIESREVLRDATAQLELQMSRAEGLEERIRVETNPQARANWEREYDEVQRIVQLNATRQTQAQIDVDQVFQAMQDTQSRLTATERQLDELDRELRPPR